MLRDHQFLVRRHDEEHNPALRPRNERFAICVSRRVKNGAPMPSTTRCSTSTSSLPCRLRAAQAPLRARADGARLHSRADDKRKPAPISAAFLLAAVALLVAIALPALRAKLEEAMQGVTCVVCMD
jgi:hypothetical protein